MSVLTRFYCTCNKYSCGTKRNPHCCSLRVGNVEPGSVVSLKGRYTLGNKLQQLVATTCRRDKSLRVYRRFFCENHYLCISWILSQQHVAKNQIRQNLCDLARQQNSVAETKILQNFSSTQEAIGHCDVSPQHVAATSRQTCTHWVICCRELLLQLVAYLKTCGHQCVHCCRRYLHQLSSRLI